MINLSTIMMAASKNMPSILTGIAITTTVAAAVECGRASIEASKVLEKMHYESETEPTTMEKVKAVSPLYIKTFILLCIACGAEFGVLADTNKKLLAMATIATSNEKEREKLEAKMKEVIGEKKTEQIKKEIIKDDVKENPPKKDHIWETGCGNVVFRDGTMGGDFLSDVENVKHAFNEMEYQLSTGNIISVNDLMSRLNRQQVDVGNSLVWVPGDSLNVTIQQEEFCWPSDLYDVTEEELNDVVWVLKYTMPHELTDEHI